MNHSSVKMVKTMKYLAVRSKKSEQPLIPKNHYLIVEIRFHGAVKRSTHDQSVKEIIVEKNV